MFFFGKKNLTSLTDEQVEKAYARDAERRKTRKKAAGLLLLGTMTGGGGLGVCAMGAMGLLAVGGGVAIAMTFCGMMGGILSAIHIFNIKPLKNWLDGQDLNAIIAERHTRMAQEQERQKVLSPAAAEAFAASVSNGVKDEVKILKPLKLKPAAAKSRRGAAFNALQ